MAIAKKGKRKIIVQDMEFYWWADGDFDSSQGHILQVTVVSEDKQFLIKYHNDKNCSFIQFIHSQFIQRDLTQNRYLTCPQFGTNTLCNPKDVSELIKWCLA